MYEEKSGRAGSIRLGLGCGGESSSISFFETCVESQDGCVGKGRGYIRSSTRSDLLCLPCQLYQSLSLCI